MSKIGKKMQPKKEIHKKQNQTKCPVIRKKCKIKITMKCTNKVYHPGEKNSSENNTKKVSTADDMDQM